MEGVGGVKVVLLLSTSLTVTLHGLDVVFSPIGVLSDVDESESAPFSEPVFSV